MVPPGALDVGNAGWVRAAGSHIGVHGRVTLKVDVESNTAGHHVADFLASGDVVIRESHVPKVMVCGNRGCGQVVIVGAIVTNEGERIVDQGLRYP